MLMRGEYKKLEASTSVKLFEKCEEEIHTMPGKNVFYYVEPNGNVIKPSSDLYNYPELFAKEYCLGKDYDYICNVKNGIKKFEEFRKKYILYNIPSSPNDIDEFMSGKLNEEEKKLLVRYLYAWLNREINVGEGDKYGTFLISVLGYDKINVRNKTIVTASENSLFKYQYFSKNGWTIINAKPIDLDEIDKAYCYKKSRCARKLNKNIKE